MISKLLVSTEEIYEWVVVVNVVHVDNWTFTSGYNHRQSNILRL